MNSRMFPPRPAFTLVELAVVVLALGVVLAALAPRVLHLGSENRIAKVQEIYGSVRAATQITHAAAIVRNVLGPGGAVQVDETQITTAWGYPDINQASGIAFAAGLDVGPQNADHLTFDTTSSSGTLYLVPAGAQRESSCRVGYTPAAGARTPPVITVASDGC